MQGWRRGTAENFTDGASKSEHLDHLSIYPHRADIAGNLVLTAPRRLRDVPRVGAQDLVKREEPVRSWDAMQSVLQARYTALNWSLKTVRCLSPSRCWCGEMLIVRLRFNKHSMVSAHRPRNRLQERHGGFLCSISENTFWKNVNNIGSIFRNSLHKTLNHRHRYSIQRIQAAADCIL